MAPFCRGNRTSEESAVGSGTDLHAQMVHKAKEEGDIHHSHGTSHSDITAHSPADENAIIDDSDSDLAWTEDVEDSEYAMRLDFRRLNHLPGLAPSRSLLTTQFQKVASTVVQRHTSESAQASCYILLHDFNGPSVKQGPALEIQPTSSRDASEHKAPIDFPPGTQRRMYGKEIDKNLRLSMLHEHRQSGVQRLPTLSDREAGKVKELWSTEYQSYTFMVEYHHKRW